MNTPVSEFKTSSQKSFQLKLIAAVLCITFLWILVEYTSLLYKSYQIDLKKQWFIEENKRLASTNQELEKQYEYYKTDYFFRKEAKRKLNKKEPGEKVIVVTGGETSRRGGNDWEIKENLLEKWWKFLFEEV